MFENIILWFQNEIFSGTLKPGKKLKSRRFYEIKFATSKKTMEKVFLVLKNLNFIYSIEKKGYFVSDVHEQNIFKSEKDLIAAEEVKIVKSKFNGAFEFAEIKKVFKLSNAILKNDFYPYYKIYRKGLKIIKISCSYNHKQVKYHKKSFEDSFYIAMSHQLIKPIQREEMILGGQAYPQLINKMLGQNTKQGVILYIALFDKAVGLFHITKQYINQDQISWHYLFKL